MQDQRKTKAQLLDEIANLRQELSRLKQAQNGEGFTSGERQDHTSKEDYALYQSALDLLPHSIVRKDKNLKYTFVNKAYLNTLDKTAEEVLGKTNYDLHPPELAEKYTKDDQQVLQLGKAIDVIEEHIAPASDERIYIRVIKTPIYNTQGQINGLQAVFWNVTERIQAEEALRKSDKRNRTLLTAMPDLMFTVKRDGTVLDFKGGQDAALYKTPMDILGQNVYEILPPHLAEQRMHYVEQALQTGQMQVFEFEIDVDGETYYEEGRIVVSGEDEVLNIVRDITDRKQAQQALTKRTEQMAALNDISLAVLGQSDARSVYETVAQALVDRFGMSFARIWTLDEVNNDLVLQVSAGEYTHTDGPHGRVSMESDRKLAWIAKQRTPHISSDLLNDPRLDNKAWAKESNTVAFAGYPLLVGNDLLGVLGMFSHQPIPDETLPLLQSLAVLIGTFVNTQRLFTQLEARAQELETVAEVGTAVSTILDADKLLQEVADLTKARFGLYHAHIYQLNNAQDSLVLVAGAGDVGRRMVAEGWQIPFDSEKSLVARAARTRQGVIVNNTHQEPDWLPNPLLPDTRSEMAVPMIVGDQVLGVLDVQASNIGRFSDEDAHIQTVLATQVGVALQNAGLFQQTQQSSELLRKRVEELNAMTDIGREIAEAPTVSDLLEWVTERIPPAMQYPHICKVAVKYQDKIYGDPEAIDLPAQIVHALRIGNQVVGRIYIAYTQKYDFLNEESAMLGGIANRTSSYIETHHLIEQVQHRAVELEESTTFLDSIIDTIPNGVFVKEAENLTFVEWNKGNEAITGLTKEEVLGKNDYDFFPKEEAEFFINADRAVLAGGKMVEIPEEEIHTAHKGVRILRTIKTPIFGADGTPRYLLGISEDITEQKQAEESLRASEARHRALFNVIPDLIVRYNSQGVHLDIKEPVGFKTFLPPEELIGKTMHEIITGPIADQRMHYLEQAIETGQLQMYEQQFETDSGTRYEEVRVVPSGNDEAFAVIRDITEQRRQQAEQQRLLAEVQRLAAIVENHPDFIGVGTMDGKALYVNPAGLKMMDLPADHDITQMDASHFYLPADAQKLANEGLPTALKEGSWTAEANLLKADGSTIPVEETIGINYDADGKPYSFSITMRDITERKQAEQQIAQQAEFLSTVIDNIPVGIFAKDVKNDYRFTIWNTKNEEIFGSKREEMINKNDYDFFLEEEANYYRQTDVAVMAERQVVDIPREEVTTNLGVILAHTIKVPIYDADGQPATLLGILEDITERERAEEALRESEERTRTILESVTVPLLISRAADGHILYANNPLANMLQVKLTDLVGQQTPNFYYNSADRAEVVGLIQKQGYVNDYELQINRSDSQSLWTLLSARLISFQGETAIFTTLIDITERKQSEAEREQLLEEVQAAYRQYVAREWGQYLTNRHQGDLHIEVDQGLVQDDNGSNGQSHIETPIALRGQVVGSLSLQDIDPNRKWTEEEQALVTAVSEQLAQTVENLRLFENTQQRASREQLTREITDKMRAAPDVESIIKTGLDELTRALDVSRTYVKLNPRMEQDK